MMNWLLFFFVLINYVCVVVHHDVQTENSYGLHVFISPKINLYARLITGAVLFVISSRSLFFHFRTKNQGREVEWKGACLHPLPQC